MRLLKLPLFLALAALLSGCNDLARWAYDAALSLEKQRAGLIDKTVSTEDGLKWHLLVSDAHQTQPPVLLVHGFGGDCSNWVRFANELEGEYFFVIPDLPGHGQTTRSLDLDYRVNHQAERLLALMDALGLSRFHVAGNSMGGAISIELARQAPDRLLSLGLIDAAGLTRRTDEFNQVLAQSEGNPLIAKTPGEFRETLAWAMEQPPYVPDFFIEVMGEKKARNADIAEKVWQDITAHKEDDLEGRGVLPTLDTPALVLWGEEDRLLGVDNVGPFLEELPNAKAVTLAGIGHVPMVEAPSESAQAFRGFWADPEQ